MPGLNLKTLSDKQKNNAYNYARHIVRTHCTIREAAEFFEVVPSTIYVYATKVFDYVYPDHVYSKMLRRIWKENKHPRLSRGRGRLATYV